MPSSESEAGRAVSLPPVRPPSPVRSERPVRLGVVAEFSGPSSPKTKLLAMLAEVTLVTELSPSLSVVVTSAVMVRFSPPSARSTRSSE